jgi:hypothetical protein
MKKNILMIIVLLMPLVSFAQDGGQSVQIISDKQEYKIGEEINLELNFNEVIYEWGEFGWVIQRWEDNSWKDVFIKSNTSYLPKCSDMDSEEIKECLSYIQREMPIWYKIEKGVVGDWRTKFTWNQTEWFEVTYTCRDVKYEWAGGKRKPVVGEIIEGKCISFEPIPAGRYKIRFEYASKINNEDASQRNEVDISHVEKEVLIK